ncbi:MAG: redoxin domain-containing protein [Verrucomicrobiota bacterium]|nr:redoxin domain-containing protein [Verrucomicrobiota bacterium]
MKFRALFVAALAAFGASAPAAETKTEPLALGAAAPDFKLPGVDDRDWSLSDFKDARALVIVFTCNHCPTAQAYEERLKKIGADYKAKGVALIAISPNDPKSLRLDELGYTDLSDTLEEMKLRARDKGFDFPYLYDGDKQEVSRAYGPTATPHAFVFDADRKLRFVGRIDDSERESAVKIQDLRNALDAILAGKTPEVAQTRVFGCSVKWAGKQDQVKAFMDKAAREPVTLETVDAAGLKALRKGAGDKFRLVNFWATWCGPCIAEFPELVEIYRMYGHRDFEMVTVSTNFPDEKEEVLKFLKNHQASMKNLLWNSGDKNALMEAFEPSWNGGVPYTVLLSPKGEIVYKEDAGAIDPLVVKRAIVDALGRQKVK